MPDDDKRPAHDAFVRWQEVSREQLGSTVKLVLTLTTASLAFAVDLLTRKDIAATPAKRWEALGLLGAAVALGVAVNVTRLLDFRWTTRAARVSRLKEKYVKEKVPSKRSLRLPEWLSQLPSSWWLRLRSRKRLAARETMAAIHLLKQEESSMKRAHDVRSSEEGAAESAIENALRTVRRACHDDADWWGKWTWRLLPCQFVLFACGIIFLGLVLPSARTSTPDPRKEIGRFAETEPGSFILVDTSTGQWCLGVSKKAPNSDLERCRDLH